MTLREITSSTNAPAQQKELLRRWSFFFVYLLFFPLLLQLLFGALTFSGSEWLNWSGALILRGAAAGAFLAAAPRLPRRVAPFLMGGVCLTAALFNLLDIFLLVNFGAVFDYGTLHLMLIAPKEEITGFFQLFFVRLTTWITLLLYPAAGLIIFKAKKKGVLPGLLLLLTAGVLFFFHSVAPGERKKVSSPYERMKGFVQSWQNTRLKKEMASAGENISCSAADEKSLILLVIGESHSRRRSSLYGSPRNTMPEMKKLYEEKKILRFNDAVTPHVMTHLALPGLLTSAGSDIKNFQNYPSVPDIFRKADFKVWYLYNQTPDTESALPFLAAARRADHFISFSVPEKQYDSFMLRELEKIIAADPPRKLVILHLQGNHWKYASTYPREESFFSRAQSKSPKAALINEYDDSLRFLDKNLAAMIRLFPKDQSGFLLYLPDHGESLYEEDNFAGHTDLYPTAATAELPMFLWFSESFSRPGIITSAKAALDAPFLSSDLPHLLMELAGIKSTLFQPERSLINPRYKKIPRRVSTKGKIYEQMKNRTFSTSKPR